MEKGFYMTKNDEAEDISTLIKALHSGDVSTHETAVRTLTQMNSKDSIPVLLQALYDNELAVRWAAAWGLGEIGDLNVIPELIKVIYDDQSLIDVVAIQALGKIEGTNNSIATLVDVLEHGHKGARRAAARSLGQIGNVVAVPNLLNALHDVDKDVCETAAQSLIQIGTFEALAGVAKYRQPNLSMPEILSALKIDGVNKAD